MNHDDKDGARSRVLQDAAHVLDAIKRLEAGEFGMSEEALRLLDETVALKAKGMDGDSNSDAYKAWYEDVAEFAQKNGCKEEMYPFVQRARARAIPTGVADYLMHAFFDRRAEMAAQQGAAEPTADACMEASPEWAATAGEQALRELEHQREQDAADARQDDAEPVEQALRELARQQAQGMPGALDPFMENPAGAAAAGEQALCELARQREQDAADRRAKKIRAEAARLFYARELLDNDDRGGFAGWLEDALQLAQRCGSAKLRESVQDAMGMAAAGDEFGFARQRCAAIDIAERLRDEFRF